MADSENFEELDMDSFDKDMDSLDFDFGDMGTEPPPPKDAREAVGRSLKQGFGGVQEAIKKPPLEYGAKVFETALPKDVTNSFSSVKSEMYEVKDFITDSTKGIRKQIGSLTNSIGDMMPKDSKIQGFFKSINEKLNDIPEQTKKMSKEAEEAAMIATAISAALGTKEQQEAKEKQLEAEIEEARFNSTSEIAIKQLSQLKAISSFNKSISDEYYRKSLEIQFKHLYTSKESLAVMTAGFNTLKTQIESIVKNTSLPDLVKLKGMEQFKETILSNFRQDMYERMFGKKTFYDHLKNKVQRKIKDFIGIGSDGIDMISQLQDGLNMGKDFGIGPAHMAGTMVADGGIDKVFKFVKDKSKITEKIEDKGSKYLTRFRNVINSPFEYLRYIADTKSDKWYGDKLGKILDFADPNEKKSTAVKEKTGEVIQFDTISRTSLVKVIPMLLSKIHLEVSAIRKDKGIVTHETEELVYDVSTKELNTVSNIVEKEKKKLGQNVYNSKKNITNNITDAIKEQTETELADDDKNLLGDALQKYFYNNGKTKIDLLGDSKFLSYIPKEKQDYFKELGKKLSNKLLNKPEELKDFIYYLDNYRNSVSLSTGVMSSYISNSGNGLAVAKRLGGYNYSEYGDSYQTFNKDLIGSAIEESNKYALIAAEEEKKRKNRTDDQKSEEEKEYEKKLEEEKKKKEEEEAKKRGETKGWLDTAKEFIGFKTETKAEKKKKKKEKEEKKKETLEAKKEELKQQNIDPKSKEGKKALKEAENEFEKNYVDSDFKKQTIEERKEREKEEKFQKQKIETRKINNEKSIEKAKEELKTILEKQNIKEGSEEYKKQEELYIATVKEEIKQKEEKLDKERVKRKRKSKALNKTKKKLETQGIDKNSDKWKEEMKKTSDEVEIEIKKEEEKDKLLNNAKGFGKVTQFAKNTFGGLLDTARKIEPLNNFINFADKQITALGDTAGGKFLSERWHDVTENVIKGKEYLLNTELGKEAVAKYEKASKEVEELLKKAKGTEAYQTAEKQAKEKLDLAKNQLEKIMNTSVGIKAQSKLESIKNDIKDKLNAGLTLGGDVMDNIINSDAGKIVMETAGGIKSLGVDAYKTFKNDDDVKKYIDRAWDWAGYAKDTALDIYKHELTQKVISTVKQSPEKAKELVDKIMDAGKEEINLDNLAKSKTLNGLSVDVFKKSNTNNILGIEGKDKSISILQDSAIQITDATQQSSNALTNSSLALINAMNDTTKGLHTFKESLFIDKETNGITLSEINPNHVKEMETYGFKPKHQYYTDISNTLKDKYKTLKEDSGREFLDNREKEEKKPKIINLNQEVKKYTEKKEFQHAINMAAPAKRTKANTVKVPKKEKEKTKFEEKKDKLKQAFDDSKVGTFLNESVDDVKEFFDKSKGFAKIKQFGRGVKKLTTENEKYQTLLGIAVDVKNFIKDNKNDLAKSEVIRKVTEHLSDFTEENITKLLDSKLGKELEEKTGILSHALNIIKEKKEKDKIQNKLTLPETGLKSLGKYENKYGTFANPMSVLNPQSQLPINQGERSLLSPLLARGQHINNIIHSTNKPFTIVDNVTEKRQLTKEEEEISKEFELAKSERALFMSGSNKARKEIEEDYNNKLKKIEEELIIKRNNVLKEARNRTFNITDNETREQHIQRYIDSEMKDVNRQYKEDRYVIESDRKDKLKKLEDEYLSLYYKKIEEELLQEDKLKEEKIKRDNIERKRIENISLKDGVSREEQMFITRKLSELGYNSKDKQSFDEYSKQINDAYRVIDTTSDNRFNIDRLEQHFKHLENEIKKIRNVKQNNEIKDSKILKGDKPEIDPIKQQEIDKLTEEENLKINEYIKARNEYESAKDTLAKNEVKENDNTYIEVLKPLKDKLEEKKQKLTNEAIKKAEEQIKNNNQKEVKKEEKQKENTDKNSLKENVKDKGKSLLGKVTSLKDKVFSKDKKEDKNKSVNNGILRKTYSGSKKALKLAGKPFKGIKNAIFGSKDDEDKKNFIYNILTGLTTTPIGKFLQFAHKFDKKIAKTIIKVPFKLAFKAMKVGINVIKGGYKYIVKPFGEFLKGFGFVGKIFALPITIINSVGKLVRSFHTSFNRAHDTIEQKTKELFEAKVDPQIISVINNLTHSRLMTAAVSSISTTISANKAIENNNDEKNGFGKKILGAISGLGKSLLGGIGKMLGGLGGLLGKIPGVGKLLRAGKLVGNVGLLGGGLLATGVKKIFSKGEKPDVNIPDKKIDLPDSKPNTSSVKPDVDLTKNAPKQPAKLDGVVKNTKPSKFKIWSKAKELFGKLKDLIVKFKDKIFKRAGKKIGAKIIGRFATLFIPGAGFIQWAVILGEAAFLMLFSGYGILKAFSHSLIGFNIFDDNEPIVDPETKMTIPDDPTAKNIKTDANGDPIEDKNLNAVPETEEGKVNVKDANGMKLDTKPIDSSNVSKRYNEIKDNLPSKITNYRNITSGSVIVDMTGRGNHKFKDVTPSVTNGEEDQVFNFHSPEAKANFGNLHPKFQEQLTEFGKDYVETFNKKPQINSTWRSFEKQAELKEQLGSKAASPGGSKHNYGIAVDINSDDMNNAEKSGLSAKHGLMRPVSGETWHVEPTWNSEIRNQLTNAFFKKEKVDDENYVEKVDDLLSGKTKVDKKLSIQNEVVEREGEDTSKVVKDQPPMVGEKNTSLNDVVEKQQETVTTEVKKEEVKKPAKKQVSLSDFTKPEKTSSNIKGSVGSADSEKQYDMLKTINETLIKSLDQQTKAAISVENILKYLQEVEDSKKKEQATTKNNNQRPAPIEARTPAVSLKA